MFSQTNISTALPIFSDAQDDATPVWAYMKISGCLLPSRADSVREILGRDRASVTISPDVYELDMHSSNIQQVIDNISRQRKTQPVKPSKLPTIKSVTKKKADSLPEVKYLHGGSMVPGLP
jgi:hypothetical protein